MKKKFTLKMLTTALFLALGVSGLAGCNPTTDPTNPDGPTTAPTDPSVEPSVDPVVVNGVTITDSEGEEPNTDVFDNQDIQLKANVDVSNSSDKADTKVTWSVDKPEVATVTSTGLVTIDPIKTESETLVVTATSKVDPTKSASVEFNIKHSIINLLNSKPMNMDLEDYYENGVIENGDHTQDTAFVYADVYDTRWYVEAEIRVMSLDPNDAYPKFGLMTGTSKYGAWQNGEDAFGMYYVDLAQASTNNWTSVNFVVGNEEHNDWMWGNQLGGAALTEKIELTKKFKLGLMRDGTDYYYYYGNSSNDYATYKCYKHVVWDGVPADTPSYAWVGGFRAATKVGGFKALTGDAVDAMYEDLTTFDVENKDVTLFLNETSKINIVTPVSNYKPTDFVYTSENPDVATVSSTGVITAGAARGTTRISVKYKDTLEVFVNVTVTDDTKFSVVLDGKMEDAIWTDEVKAHPYTFSRKNLDVNITLYAARNSRGIYLYANYQAAETFISGNWWEDDNMEFRFNGVDGQLKNKEEFENNTGNPTQYWISQFNGGQSNFTAEYISGDKYDEATGMYTIIFEMFASYEYLGCAEDALIGFSMGANPGGRYWWNNECWNTYDFYATNKITENGIVRYYDETGCEHIYGDYKVVTQASCAQAGEEERFCKKCNHKDTKVVPQGEHSFTGAITANSEGSCMGTQACIGGCGNTTPVVMDSYTKHEAWNEEAHECTACHNKVNVKHEVNRWDAGGWADESTWFIAADHLVGEFDVHIKYTIQVNGPTGNWWKGVLPIMQDRSVEGWGSLYVHRFDWWGWVDKCDSPVSLANRDGNAAKDAGAVDAPEWMPNAGANWDSTWVNAKVDLHMKKTATDLINEFTVTPLEGPNAGQVWAGYGKVVNPVLTTSIRCALSAEFANFQVTACYVNQ
jgi:hypothetical protein